MLYAPSTRNVARKPTGAKLAQKPVHMWASKPGFRWEAELET